MAIVSSCAGRANCGGLRAAHHLTKSFRAERYVLDVDSAQADVTLDCRAWYNCMPDVSAGVNGFAAQPDTPAATALGSAVGTGARHVGGS